MKAIRLLIIVLMLAILTACGNNGSGEITELPPKEVQKFANEGTGFLYNKSMLENDLESDQMILNEMGKIGEELEVDYYVYDTFKYQKSLKDDFDIDIYTETLAFFLNGEKKEELRLGRVEPTAVNQELTQFIQGIKDNYY